MLDRQIYGALLIDRLYKKKLFSMKNRKLIVLLHKFKQIQTNSNNFNGERALITKRELQFADGIQTRVS